MEKRVYDTRDGDSSSKPYTAPRKGGTDTGARTKAAPNGLDDCTEAHSVEDYRLENEDDACSDSVK